MEIGPMKRICFLLFYAVILSGCHRNTGTISGTVATSGQDTLLLRLADNPILKLDAPTAELAALINKPVGKYDPDAVVEGMMRFEGDFILQTIFIRCKGFDSSSPEVLGPWMDIVRKLHPREIMAYTIARPTPMKGIEKFSAEEMRAILAPLFEEGYNIQIKA